MAAHHWSSRAQWARRSGRRPQRRFWRMLCSPPRHTSATATARRSSSCCGLWRRRWPLGCMSTRCANSSTGLDMTQSMTTLAFSAEGGPPWGIASCLCAVVPVHLTFLSLQVEASNRLLDVLAMFSPLCLAAGPVSEPVRLASRREACARARSSLHAAGERVST